MPSPKPDDQPQPTGAGSSVPISTTHSLRDELRRCGDRFDQIATQCVGRDAISDALVDDIRAAQAAAGRTLVQLADGGFVEAPAPPPPWWRMVRDDFDDVPFDDLVFASGITGGRAPQPRDTVPGPLAAFLERESEQLGLNLATDSNARGVAKIVKAFHELHERHERPGIRATTLEEYIHRHVFIEAVAEWMPLRHPELGGPIELPASRWVTREGKRISVLADCIGTRLISADGRPLVRLAERCALACRVIEASTAPAAAVQGGAAARSPGIVRSPAIARRPRREWLGSALFVVKDHPEWPDAKVAREVGISRSQLSRAPEYKRAARLARDQGGTPKRGHRDREDSGQRNVDGCDDNDASDAVAEE